MTFDALVLGSVWCFTQDETWVMDLGMQSTEVSIIFTTLYQGWCYSTGHHHGPSPWSPGRGNFVRFLHFSSSSFFVPLSVPSYLGEVTLHSPHVGMGSYAPPLEGRASTTIIDIWNSSSWEICLFCPNPSLYSIMSLYLPRLVDVCFIIHVLMQCIRCILIALSNALH